MPSLEQEVGLRKYVSPRLVALICGYLIFSLSHIFIGKKDPFDSSYLVVAQIPSLIAIPLIFKKDGFPNLVFQFLGESLYLIVHMMASGLAFLGMFLIPIYMIPGAAIYAMVCSRFVKKR